MKHYSQMTDSELGEIIEEMACRTYTAAIGAAARKLIDSMMPSELAEVREEVDRTAQVVMALATGRTFWITQNITDGETPYVQALAAEESRLIVLRARQRDLEAKLSAQKFDGCTPRPMPMR